MKNENSLGLVEASPEPALKTYLSCSVACRSGNSGFRCSFGYQYGYNGLEPVQRLGMHFT